MRRLIAYCIVLIGLLFTACNKDNFTATLNYDGNNVTSPTLPAGTYELAARFPADETSRHNGTQLEQVEWFMVQDAQFLRLKIYGEGSNGLPGEVLYSKDVSRDIRLGGWNTHDLDDPILIEGQEIWISIRVTLGDTQQSLGCDGGPANPNGDLVFINDTDDWITYRDWTGESVNWNIRGNLR